MLERYLIKCHEPTAKPRSFVNRAEAWNDPAEAINSDKRSGIHTTIVLCFMVRSECEEDVYSKMRWVLIRPHNSSPYYDPEIQEPLGLEYLSGCLSELGDPVLLLDCSLEGVGTTRLARRAASFRPDVVGFSLTTAQEVPSLHEIHSEFKAVSGSENVRWVAGGNFISTEPEQAYSLLPPEMTLVRFEGEEALSGLRNAWLLTCREAPPELECSDAGATQKIVLGDPVADLDSLPFPIRPYANTILANDGAMNIQASRGCCGNCTFCASPGMSKNGRNHWRGRTISNIVDEIETLFRIHGAQCFNIVDEDFLGSNYQAAKRGHAMAQEILTRDLRISFSIQVRPDSLSKSVIDALAEAGLSYVFMGLETDSAELLKRWRRPPVSNPWRFVDRFRGRGVEVNVGAMLFHRDATLDSIHGLAAKLDRYGLLDYRSATNRQVAMPGSFLFSQLVKYPDHGDVSPGPQVIPCINSKAEILHGDLVAALAPLGPPSMEATCALPRVVARQRLKDGDTNDLISIQAILHDLRRPVMETLASLLESYANGEPKRDEVDRLRQRNLQVALDGAERISKHAHCASLEALRNAIEMDADM
jgi:radical SAM family protein/B12 binding protein